MITRARERTVWLVVLVALADVAILVAGRSAERARDDAFALAEAQMLAAADDPATGASGNRERWTCDGYAALTFDDGPHPETTPELLDILQAYGFRATFFLVGRQVERHPELTQRIADDGHVLANHTFDHPDLRRTGDRDLDEQLASTNELLAAASGSPPRWYRPPFGATDDRVRARAARHGLTEVLWSVDTNDWRPGVSDADVAARVATAEDGDVVLLHDRGRMSTPVAVAAVVEEFRRRGLCSGALVPLPEDADVASGRLEGVTVGPWGAPPDPRGGDLRP
jgi:peptidoglycan-N-acetylglucosamine deacetylase